MGIIKRGILGGFSGKVANIVGTSWKGRAVMKSLPLSVANPRSAGQVKQRTRFSVISKLASSINVQWVKPLWDRFAGDISGYNDFVKQNIVFVTDAGLVIWADLKLSIGDLFNSGAVPEETVQVGANRVTVDLSTDLGINGLSTDVCNIQLFDEANNEPYGFANTSTRADSSMIVPFPSPATQDQKIAMYCSYLRSDGTLVSDAVYYQINIGG